MVRDGYYYGAGLVAVAIIVFLLTGFWGWAIIPLLLAAFFLWFFRDPERTIPEQPGLIVSPADGKVTRAERVMTPDGARLHLSIFLSVFNVHVNRSPADGILTEVRYQKGLYLNALNPDSAEKNEQTLAILQSGEGTIIAFKMIAGLLARRIVFRPRTGDRLERGQRVGLIKFGSRVDVLLPAQCRLRVKVGDTVKGGSSILASLELENEGPDSADLAELLTR